ncbi:unnamed protein product [Cochlearia groenlandica]
MNSMFSTFDAMCAEIMGKKITYDSYDFYRSERNATASSSGCDGQTASSTVKDEDKTAAKRHRCLLWNLMGFIASRP